MFDRILIANRGEIALRILRACKALGADTVCVYSEADADASYLRFATESIRIGPGPVAQSYLDMTRIISAAEIADVAAIHPGYGFLSENEQFAEVCRSCNINFIGPSPELIGKMGNKSVAREIAKNAGVPVIPGSDGKVESEEDALRIASEIGYPVIIKASAGGGGRGMRVAHNSGALVKAFTMARAEAEAAFKDPTVYIEKFLDRSRHVEIQIMADKFGNVVHLGERDCTIQRRNQKLIEESPSPAISEETRLKMGRAACELCRAIKYDSVGTIEFLVMDDETFYFIEMNTRIQVEHPVTEMVTGIDLLQEQIKIAAGERLSVTQQDIQFRGHSIECRINAEDPENDFKPSPGKIESYFIPGGPNVRVDSHCYGGYKIPPFYDSLIGKVIVHAPTREEAIGSMLRALDEYTIGGIKTTIPLLKTVLNHASFRRGQVHTGFLAESMGL
ncbi:MAG: acetyl-CoA carboxylase biotin carboxylase subunit [Planctomycetota bacterium]|nr:acetyl-CoA carboxylase biotin carboxylase subunit [Planctomycetota bacterium]